MSLFDPISPSPTNNALAAILLAALLDSIPPEQVAPPAPRDKFNDAMERAMRGVPGAVTAFAVRGVPDHSSLYFAAAKAASMAGLSVESGSFAVLFVPNIPPQWHDGVLGSRAKKAADIWREGAACAPHSTAPLWPWAVTDEQCRAFADAVLTTNREEGCIAPALSPNDVRIGLQAMLG